MKKNQISTNGHIPMRAINKRLERALASGQQKVPDDIILDNGKEFVVQTNEREISEAKCGISADDISEGMAILKPETVGELTVTVEFGNLERLQHLLKVTTKKAKKLRKAIREINELEACTDDDLIINQKPFRDKDYQEKFELIIEGKIPPRTPLETILTKTKQDPAWVLANIGIHHPASGTVFSYFVNHSFPYKNLNFHERSSDCF